MTFAELHYILFIAGRHTLPSVWKRSKAWKQSLVLVVARSFKSITAVTTLFVTADDAVLVLKDKISVRSGGFGLETTSLPQAFLANYV